MTAIHIGSKLGQVSRKRVPEGGLETPDRGASGEDLSEALTGTRLEQDMYPEGSPLPSRGLTGDDVDLSLSQWFSVIVMKHRLQYRLSNSVVVLLLNVWPYY